MRAQLYCHEGTFPVKETRMWNYYYLSILNVFFWLIRCVIDDKHHQQQLVFLPIWNNPGLFSFILVLFSNNLQENVDFWRDSNLTCWSRRLECWPLDHYDDTLAVCLWAVGLNPFYVKCGCYSKTLSILEAQRGNKKVVHLMQPVQSKNTHLLHKGKYHCTADILLDCFGFDQTCKSLSNSTQTKQLNPSRSNRRSVVQWYFPLQSKLVFSGYNST